MSASTARWCTMIVTLGALLAASACSLADKPSSSGTNSSPQATRQTVVDVVRLVGDAAADHLRGTIRGASGGFQECEFGGYQYTADVTLAGLHYATNAAASRHETDVLKAALTGAGYTEQGATPPGDDSDGGFSVGKDGVRVSLLGPVAFRAHDAPAAAFRSMSVTTDCISWKGADKSYVERALLDPHVDEFADVVAEVAARARKH